MHCQTIMPDDHAAQKVHYSEQADQQCCHCEACKRWTAALDSAERLTWQHSLNRREGVASQRPGAQAAEGCPAPGEDVAVLCQRGRVAATAGGLHHAHPLQGTPHLLGAQLAAAVPVPQAQAAVLPPTPRPYLCMCACPHSAVCISRRPAELDCRLLAASGKRVSTVSPDLLPVSSGIWRDRWCWRQGISRHAKRPIDA